MDADVAISVCDKRQQGNGFSREHRASTHYLQGCGDFSSLQWLLGVPRQCCIAFFLAAVWSAWVSAAEAVGVDCLIGGWMAHDGSCLPNASHLWTGGFSRERCGLPPIIRKNVGIFPAFNGFLGGTQKCCIIVFSGVIWILLVHSARAAVVDRLIGGADMGSLMGDAFCSLEDFSRERCELPLIIRKNVGIFPAFNGFLGGTQKCCIIFFSDGMWSSFGFSVNVSLVDWLIGSVTAGVDDEMCEVMLSVKEGFSRERCGLPPITRKSVGIFPAFNGFLGGKQKCCTVFLSSFIMELVLSFIAV
jgi:hypothetical protein